MRVSAFPNCRSSTTSLKAPNPIAPYATHPISTQFHRDPAYPSTSAITHVTTVRTIDNLDALNSTTPRPAIPATASAATTLPTHQHGLGHSRTLYSRLLLQRTNERNHVLHLLRRHGLVGRHLRRLAIGNDSTQLGIALLLYVGGSEVRGLH